MLNIMKVFIQKDKKRLGKIFKGECPLLPKGEGELPMPQIQIDGLCMLDENRFILVINQIDENDIENPYVQFSFNGGLELEDFYNRYCGRNLNCSLKDLEEAVVLAENGSSPVEVLSKLIAK